jgi:hypothetical protein
MVAIPVVKGFHERTNGHLLSRHGVVRLAFSLDMQDGDLSVMARGSSGR